MAQSQHIEIGSGARLGGQLRSIHDSMWANINALTAMKATLDTFAGDFVAMGAALGLTGPDAAAQAETIYSLLAAMNPEFDKATNTKTFLAVLG